MEYKQIIITNNENINLEENDANLLEPEEGHNFIFYENQYKPCLSYIKNFEKNHCYHLIFSAYSDTIFQKLTFILYNENNGNEKIQFLKTFDSQSKTFSLLFVASFNATHLKCIYDNYELESLNSRIIENNEIEYYYLFPTKTIKKLKILDNNSIFQSSESTPINENENHIMTAITKLGIQIQPSEPILIDENENHTMTVITKLGIQAPPFTPICINKNSLYIGKSGVFEIQNFNIYSLHLALQNNNSIAIIDWMESSIELNNSIEENEETNENEQNNIEQGG